MLHRKFTPISGLSATALIIAAVAIAVFLWRGPLQADSEGSPTFPSTLTTVAEDGSEQVLSIDDVSPAQAEALVDEIVTFEEYEAGVWAAFSCITGQGIEAREEPHLDPSGLILEHSVWNTGDPAEDERITRVVSECLDEHLTFVDLAYAIQIRPSDDVVAAARAAMAACLIEGGFPPAQVHEDRLLEVSGHDVAAFAACSGQISAEFGIPHFAG